MIRYIYEIKNKVNNKTYIGQHSLKEGIVDNYMGSGILLHKAYDKYGIENFEKTILLIGNFTKEEINELEIKYIKEYKCIGKAEYNIVANAFGGDTSKTIDYKKVGESIRQTYINNPEKGKRTSERMKKNPILVPRYDSNNGMFGKVHSEYTRKLLSDSHKGEKNNQYGKHWYTNGTVNICSFECPEGFKKGRVLNDDKNKPFKGKHWYTNGTINIQSKECPDGFKKGITFKK